MRRNPFASEDANMSLFPSALVAELHEDHILFHRKYIGPEFPRTPEPPGLIDEDMPTIRAICKAIWPRTNIGLKKVERGGLGGSALRAERIEKSPWDEVIEG